MKSGIITHSLMLLAAVSVSAFCKAQIKEGEFGRNNKYTAIRVYTPPVVNSDKELLTGQLNSNLKYVYVHRDSVYGKNNIWSLLESDLRASEDMIRSKSGILFYFSDILRDTIRVNEMSDKTFTVSVPVSDICLRHDRFKHVVIFEFGKKEGESARAFAGNIFYVQKLYNDLQTEDSIRFNAMAAKYHQLKEKPVMSEDQRRLLVQASTLANEKKYAEATGCFEKAMVIDATSFPPAYFNMALIAAQAGRYRYAILNMKKYLLLVPDAPDARTAQDKIYEWELKL